MDNKTHNLPITLRIKQLAALLSISKSNIWSKLNPASRYFDPLFPKPIKIGCATCFVSSEVTDYIEFKISAGRAPAVSKTH